MKSIKTLLVIAAAAMASQSASADINNPITRAVIDTYTQQIEAHPDDYQTLMKRATEYYRNDETMSALSDINDALEVIPANDTDTRFRALSLRAAIYQDSGRNAAALDDLNAAIQINPTSYSTVYQRANVNYLLANYSDAKDDFNRMRRINSRSPEALIGLARVAVKENNIGLANDYLNDAVSLDPSNAEVYARRASVKRLMNNASGAVDDLIIALSRDSRCRRAIDTLVEMSDGDYEIVISGLTRAIAQAPDVVMFRYMRAMIAQHHYRYKDAIADYQAIIDSQSDGYLTVYVDMAECHYALCEFDDALAAVNTALGIKGLNSTELLLAKAKILRAKGEASSALDVAQQALAINPDNNDAIVEVGLCAIANKDYQRGADLFGEAMLNDPDKPYYFMLRAWALNDYLNQPVAASGFYSQVSEMDNFDIDDVNSFKGFALLYGGYIYEAKAWMDNILRANTDNDGRLHYIAACLYAAAGDTATALDCVETSLTCGYANRYDWEQNTTARLNPAPLRSLPRFRALLTSHSSIF